MLDWGEGDDSDIFHLIIISPVILKHCRFVSKVPARSQNPKKNQPF